MPMPGQTHGLRTHALNIQLGKLERDTPLSTEWNRAAFGFLVRDLGAVFDVLFVSVQPMST